MILFGGCGKSKRWKTQNILLGKSTEKRNSDYCFVFASILVTGPLEISHLRVQDPVYNLRNVTTKVNCSTQVPLLQWVMPWLKIALILSWTKSALLNEDI